MKEISNFLFYSFEFLLCVIISINVKAYERKMKVRLLLREPMYFLDLLFNGSHSIIRDLVHYLPLEKLGFKSPSSFIVKK